VPVKNAPENQEEGAAPAVQGVGDLSVGATIHALRCVKGATAIPTDQQVLSGGVENYRSNLLLSLIGSGLHNASFVQDGNKGQNRVPTVTEQQMIMKELCGGSPDGEPEIQALAGLSNCVNSIRLYTQSLRFCRLPSANLVLHDHSTCIRASKQQALGCLKAARVT
jgi:hypothetical protein